MGGCRVIASSSRMQECPMAANGIVLRNDVLERSGHVRCEDDVDDVLAVGSGPRRDRVDDGDGPLERHIHPVVEQPGLLPQLAPQRVDEALTQAHAPAREQPDLAGRPSRVEAAGCDPASAESRTREFWAPSSRHVDDEPNPWVPRSLAVSSSTSTRRTAATGTTTSCATRIPGSTEKASSPVFRRTIRISPR